MTTATLDFSDLPDAEDVPDAIPGGMLDIEYPCANCGREVGYRGRGRKPTAKSLCPECKPSRKSSASPKVTGAASSLAAQATEVLSQMNAMIAMGAMAFGLTATAQAIFAGDEMFKAQAYNALVTDKEFCAFILKGGVKSSKVALAMAYGGLGMSVVPVALMELRERKAAREAAEE